MDDQKGSSDSSDDVSESCYSEDEEEPRLKYERLGEDLNEIFKKDSASCVSITDKLIVLGTNSGRLHILDHQGNKIRMFQLCTTPVTMISLDETGDYIAAASQDKKVNIQGLFNNDHTQVIDTSYHVKSLALDPNYGKIRSSRRFVIGDHRLCLYEKTKLWGTSKISILYEGARSTGELIRTIQWQHGFLTWASDSSIKIMHVESREIVSLIKRDHSLALGCDQYPSHICWKDESTILIGWGDSVKVCRIRERNLEEASRLGLPPYVVEIVYMFTTDFYVCGIGPLDDHVIVLAYNKGFNSSDTVKDKSTNEWRRPQIRLLQPMQGTHEEISKDVLAIRSYQDNQPCNYHLAYLTEERRFYIVCPRDFVIAKPREAHDRVQWLLEHERFQEALQVLDENNGRVGQYSSQSVGDQFIDHLLRRQEYEAAAAVCSQVLKGDRLAWEDVIKKFIELGQISALTTYVPTGGHSVTLSRSVYQNILLDLLRRNHEAFFLAVKTWPKNFYDIADLINRVLGVLTQNTNNNALLRSLAHLYSNAEKHDKALAIYLKLKDVDIFALIEKHNLWSCVSKHIVELMRLDMKKSLSICSNHLAVIDPKSVVHSLMNEQEYLYHYLNMLYEGHLEESASYHNILFNLYAKYNRTNMLSLLRASSTIELKPALKIAKQYNLSQETVYLLVRMGNTEAALRHLLDVEDDIWAAIKICKDHLDPDLWCILINHSLKRPDYMKALLNHIGAHVDPLLIIRRIPRTVSIPDLKNALIKILHDCHLKVSLHEGYQTILMTDNVKLLQKQCVLSSTAVAVRGDSVCSICLKNICHKEESHIEDTIVFGCRHVYHSSCLELADNCIVCQSSKRLIPS